MTSLRPAVVAAALLALALLTGCAGGSSNSPAPVDDDPSAVESEAPVDDASDDTAGDTAAEPSDPAPAPPAAPASSYATGDAFDETCSVAWPSAPQVTATDIQITAYCPNVPSSYPVVLVVYPDPTLPITPNTGSFHVVGEVYGSAQSQAGMPYLIVVADVVQL